MTTPRKTKMVCTLGPAVQTPERMRALMEAGMNVARFNFSHADHPSHEKTFRLFDQTRRELGLPIAAMLDTKGPEVRTGVMQGGAVTLEAGALLTLTPQPAEGTAACISVTHAPLAQDVRVGGAILIDDGLIALTVEEIRGDDILCRVENGGVVGDRKGVNIPGAVLSMPYLSERDKSDILFGAALGFDFIAASFVSGAEDVLAVRRLLESAGRYPIGIIAKIESARGVENIDEILRVCDGIMIARGDLGVEVPYEEVPIIQKALIKKALACGKMSITATQMLESMTQKPRPTRAEATDVANAIYDGTSAVMLSGETAAGKYPIEAARTMASIALRTEADINYRRRMLEMGNPSGGDMTYAIAHATCSIAHDLDAAAIVPVTHSGYTARMVSSFRPDVPILGCTPSEPTWRQLSLSWGVTPVLLREHHNGDELFSDTVSIICEQGLVENGGVVVLTAGVPLGIPGTTNLIKVDMAGNLLASGRGIGQGSVTARLCVAHDEEEARARFQAGDILVVPGTGNALMDLLRMARAIVTEEDGDASHAAVAGQALGIPVLVGVERACSRLKNGATVCLDAAAGRICRATQGDC